MIKQQQRSAVREFYKFVRSSRQPCLAARGAAKRDDIAVSEYGTLGSRDSARLLAPDLREFTRKNIEASRPGRRFASFVALFDSRGSDSGETGFESDLWRMLAFLSEEDEMGWSERVSSEPADKTFAFSFHGEPYYVIGMHPDASRPGRRFSRPALVFNLHRQFDRLREDGAYDSLRDSIRERDLRVNGSINPSLSDFGVESEARQYSGRAVDKTWRCPFSRIFSSRKET